MHNSNVPSDAQLPSKGKLLKSSCIATVVAGVILVTLVLPAEYGIDPTGVGRLTGLQRMGEIKTSLAKEAEAEREATLAALAEPEAESVAEQVAEPAAVTQVESGLKTDEMSVTLAPDESTEIKLKMSKGDKAEFIWYTDGSKANFDLHADSKELEINYHSYAKGKDSRSEGTLEAAFDGSHGWYWRNRTDSPITITLETSGEYQSIKRMD